jgi:hypothetical protein
VLHAEKIETGDDLKRKEHPEIIQIQPGNRDEQGPVIEEIPDVHTKAVR